MRDVARWRGISAMAGGILALLITPVLAASYPEAWEDWTTPVIEAIRSVAEPVLGFDSGATVYQTWGRIYAVPVVLMAFGMIPFPLPARDRVGLIGGAGVFLSTAGWTMATVGVVVDYVIGRTWGASVYDASFIAEILGALALLAGALLTGLAARREGAVPSWACWALVLALPLGLVGVTALAHIPSGPMTGGCVVSIATGYLLWSGTAASAVGPARSLPE